MEAITLLYRVSPLLLAVSAIVAVFFLLKLLRDNGDNAFVVHSPKEIRFAGVVMILFAVLYCIAAVLWLSDDNGDKIPAMEDLLWSAIEGGYWLFVMLFAIHTSARLGRRAKKERKKEKDDESMIEFLIDHERPFKMILVFFAFMILWVGVVVVVFSEKTAALRDIIKIFGSFI
jgi:uncharacterized membrane protein